MRWERAKSFIIIFFAATNIILALLIHHEAEAHSLTTERETALNTVLARNNIVLTNQLVNNFAPMRLLQLDNYDYDIDRLLAMFFPEDADIAHATATNFDEFTWQNSQLTISNGYIAFVAGHGVIGVPEIAAAIELTQNFIDTYYPHFILDINSTRLARRGGLRLFYRQEYQGQIIHTNFVEFLVTGYGDNLAEIVIEEVDIQYGVPIGFMYLPQNLVGPDEALLTFMQNIRLQNTETIFINHMDIAYFQTMSGLRENYLPTNVYATPFYRIFVEGYDSPFLINAHTNQIF
ncbi:MAG: hypothetical protein FWG68_09405 [Defluviitaleaceae bacterium]|nr:hypothetical protein [Defluviitaleaceae bacterium]